MKPTKSNQAFTLVELLVVVLIIGILAAVALPQYKKAVGKSRFLQLKLGVEKIAQAQEVYFLENGHYTDNMDELALEMPANTGENSFLLSGAEGGNGEASASGYGVTYRVYYDRNKSSSYSHRRECIVLTKSAVWLHNLCKESLVSPGNYTEDRRTIYYSMQ